MFGIGETELVIIVVFAFMLFGPDKLPGMGRTLGRVLRQFREASDGFTEVVQTNIMDPASEELEKSPKQRKREAAETLIEDGAESDDAVQEEAAPKRETFAERKARLLAERKAAAAAEDSAESSNGGMASKDAEQDDAESQEQPEAKDDHAAQAAAPTSAANLYAMGGQKSTRARAKEAAAQDKPALDESDASIPGEEDGNAEA